VPDKEEVLQKAKLNQMEGHILSLIDGERTVLQIRQIANQDSLLVDRALYALLALGLIRRKKKEVKQKQAPITLELLAKIIERIRSL